MKRGWLINDCLTCIPNTKTFWHNLLEWFPDMVDKTGGYTNYGALPSKIENDAQQNGSPDYIVRNCTFFRKLNLNVKTISLLQDYYPNNGEQINVANSSDIVVFNSPFTYSLYKDKVSSRIEIIPLGVNPDVFNETEDYSEELGILPNSILFVGAATVNPKGFDLMTDIINQTNYNFCLVMKDGYVSKNPRVRVFNKIPQEMMVKVYNSCRMVLCTSRMETQHLGGIEGAMCGLPIVATNVGAYFGMESGEWGRKANNIDEFKKEIEYVFNNFEQFDSRQYFINLGYDLEGCKNNWNRIINKL